MPTYIITCELLVEAEDQASAVDYVLEEMMEIDTPCTILDAKKEDTE